jgi:hypothetical protein
MAGYTKTEYTPEQQASFKEDEDRIYALLEKGAQVKLFEMKVKLKQERHFEARGGKPASRVFAIEFAAHVGDEWINLDFDLWNEDIDRHLPFLEQYCADKWCVVAIPQNAITCNETRFHKVRRVKIIFDLTTSIELLDHNPYLDPPLTEDVEPDDADLADAPF